MCYEPYNRGSIFIRTRNNKTYNTKNKKVQVEKQTSRKRGSIKIEFYHERGHVQIWVSNE